MKKILASLKFERITVPVVRTDMDTYVFGSMRLGIPFNVISYCLKKHPNEVLSIGQLKTELKANGIDANGLNNVKENIRQSWFGEKQALSVFIEVSPQAFAALEGRGVKGERENQDQSSERWEPAKKNLRRKEAPLSSRLRLLMNEKILKGEPMKKIFNISVWVASAAVISVVGFTAAGNLNRFVPLDQTHHNSSREITVDYRIITQRLETSGANLQWHVLT